MGGGRDSDHQPPFEATTTNQQMDHFSDIGGILLPPSWHQKEIFWMTPREHFQAVLKRENWYQGKTKSSDPNQVVLSSNTNTKHRLSCRLHRFLPANNRSRAADLHHLSWHLFNHKHWQHLKPQCMSPSVAFVTIKPKKYVGFMKSASIPPIPKQKHFH